MKNNTFIKIASIVVASSLLLFVTYCGNDPGNDDSVPVSITFNIPSVKMKSGKVLSAPSPSIVKSITITISAADMVTMSYTFNVSAGTTSVSLFAPPGMGRTFKAYAYSGSSGSGFLFYQGTSSNSYDLTVGVATSVLIDEMLGKFVDVISGDDASGDGSPANPFKTISRGLAASVVDEPINVAAGVYNFLAGEAFPLQLQPGTKLNCYGASYTTVIDIEDPYSPAIQGAAGASIDGCKIINAGPAVDDVGSQITVTNNWIENYCDALYIGANSTVSNNTIQFADSGEVLCDGIVISSLATVTPVISNNKITNNNNAIYLSQNANPTISGNTITDNSTGIYLWSNSMPTITGNTIRSNNVGVNIDSTSRAWLNNNVLSCNTGIDLATFSNYSIDATSNQWDNTTLVVEFSTCPYNGEDICNNGIGPVDYTGNSVAPSPCPTPVS